jgi:hypothetical protein
MAISREQFMNRGSAPPDHPMFKEGATVFTNPHTKNVVPSQKSKDDMEDTQEAEIMEQDIGKLLGVPNRQAPEDSPIFREGPSSFTLPPGMTGKYLKKRKSVAAEAVIDLTELEGWPSGYLDVIASGLTTAEQRMEEDRDEDMGCPIGRLKMRFGHRGLPRKWVVEYGWPGVLDIVREYARNNNIKLIEPESYLSGDIKVTHD